MKRNLYLIVFAVIVLSLLGCAGLPKSVSSQSRKDVVESETWKEFDKSGDVKFLQVQTTAPKSNAGKGSVLDGSYGERLIEVKAGSSVNDTVVVWTLANKGPSTIWIVAGLDIDTDLPVSVEAESEVSVKTMMDEDRYTYIVVDNEGGGKTELGISAKCGETDAKTTRGKSMKILWF